MRSDVGESSGRMQAGAYTPFWRAVAALLLVLGRGSMLVLLVLLLFFETRLANPLRLIRWFTVLCLLPELISWAIARASRVELRIVSESLVLDQRERRIEIPLESIERIEQWAIPLPTAGVDLRLKSGSRFHYGLELENPETLIGNRVGEAQTEIARGSMPGRIVAAWTGTWRDALLKFPVFALVPAVPLFRLHQWITYGGTFGEYYLYGLEAYVLAFVIYWANTTIWLVLYAAALRVVIAAGVLTFGFMKPNRVAAAARAGDWLHRMLYFGGVAAFLVRLYLLSRV